VVEKVLEFVRVLRGRGLVVSPAEAADALKAIASLPMVVGDWQLFETVLGATLVKRVADVEVFREEFAAFFFPDEGSGRDPAYGHAHDHGGEGDILGLDVVPELDGAMDAGDERHEHGRRVDLRRFFGEGVQSAGDDHHAGDRWRMTWLGHEQRLDRADVLTADTRAVGGDIGLRRVVTAGRPGRLQPGGGVELPRDVVLRGSRGESINAGDDRIDDEAAARTRRQMAQGSTIGPDASSGGRRIEGERDLLDLRLETLTGDEPRRLERAVERMGWRLGGAPGSRRSVRAGRLDARWTARRAAMTDGVPFAPVFLARRDDRPRLIVLCDVSLSVRGAAGFLLRVARAAQRQGGRVRSFVFVRELAEVTRLLTGEDLETAIGAIFDGRLLDTAEASDAGAALRDLVGKYGHVLSRKATVLVLGDGRNNGRDPGLEAIEAIRERCRRVVWLTPEERGTWRLAGCDVPRYAMRCDLVASVRSVTELERVVQLLAR
jgi:uncharacterized protein with von Willebrand factor type A (vWA) domain